MPTDVIGELAEIKLNVNRIANEMQHLQPILELFRKMQLDFEAYKVKLDQLGCAIADIPDRVQSIEKDILRTEPHVQTYHNHCITLNSLTNIAESHERRIKDLEDDRKRIIWAIVEKLIMVSMAAGTFYAVAVSRGIM